MSTAHHFRLNVSKLLTFISISLIFCYSLVAIDSTETIFAPLFGADQKNNSKSSSGDGSDLIQTAHIRERIPQLIKQLNIKSFLDAPCGDFFWMKTVDLGVERYIGVDVIQKIILKNREVYENEINQFIHLDLLEGPIPQADLILCRDCLVHCSFTDIATIIDQFKKSESKYLLTTSFPGRLQNKCIRTGDWFPINLCAPPFNFPEPLLIINENCTEQGGIYSDKSLLLWDLDSVPALNHLHQFNGAITILSQTIKTKPQNPWVHHAVIGSLKRGLKHLCVDFNYNPVIQDLNENVIVLNDFDALDEAIILKSEGKIKKLVVGPNLTFHANPIQMSPEIDFLIAPSEWFRDLQTTQLPSLKNRFAIWSSGVDITYWKPTTPKQSTNNVLVYHKNGSENFCRTVEDSLRAMGWNPIRITYGAYHHDEYKKLLELSQFSVFLSHFEMQGIALAEAWAMNVPTLVWNPKECNYLGVSFLGSSAPLLNDATGDFWETIEDLHILLGKLPNRLETYSPRRWVTRNLSDEVSASQLLNLFTLM